MSKFRRRGRNEERRAEMVSRAVQFPDLEWDRSTREIASMGRLLEAGIVPDENVRAAWKRAMLDEFDRLHGPVTNTPGVVVIADIDPVSTEDAGAVAERFAAMLNDRCLEQ